MKNILIFLCIIFTFGLYAQYTGFKSKEIEELPVKNTFEINNYENPKIKELDSLIADRKSKLFILERQIQCRQYEFMDNLKQKK